MAVLKYITSTLCNHNSVTSLTDSTNWAIDKAVIKVIRVETDSTDWDFSIGCDSDWSSGMYSDVKLADGLSGNQILLVDIPIIDNDSNSVVHCLFYDNNTTDNSYVEIYGEEAQT